jgi:hypothetical protein
MSNEERVKAEPCAEAFKVCLVDGDATENAREKKIRSRAIGISVLLQTAGLAVLLIAPLFAKQELLAQRVVMPIPPYSHAATQRNANQAPTAGPPRPVICRCRAWHAPQPEPAPEGLNVPGPDPALQGNRINIIDTDRSRGEEPPHVKTAAVGHIDQHC